MVISVGALLVAIATMAVVLLDDPDSDTAESAAPQQAKADAAAARAEAEQAAAMADDAVAIAEAAADEALAAALAAADGAMAPDVVARLEAQLQQAWADAAAALAAVATATAVSAQEAPAAGTTPEDPAAAGDASEAEDTAAAGDASQPEDADAAVPLPGETPRVPPVRGRNRVDAEDMLQNAGFQVIVIDGPSQAEAGTVVFQEPASGTELALGEAVTITVSTGSGQIFVPDVRGQTLTQAFNTLIAQGFRVGERREPSATVEEGQIIDTDPPHGFPVSVGLEVFVIISDGPPLVAIPDVKGLLFDTGRLTIESVGLVIGTVTFEPVEPGSSDVGRILAQTPPPNHEVAPGTPVVLVVGDPTEFDPGPTEPVDGEEGETENQDPDQTGAGASGETPGGGETPESSPQTTLG